MVYLDVEENECQEGKDTQHYWSKDIHVVLDVKGVFPEKEKKADQIEVLTFIEKYVQWTNRNYKSRQAIVLFTPNLFYVILEYLSHFSLTHS